MPSTVYSEAALARRREKQECAAAFPGRLAGWEAAVGRTVEVAVPTTAGVLLVFTDGAWLMHPAPASPEALVDALLAAECLARHHPEAWAELHRRLAAEREAMRLARMEKVLGAVETNLTEIPELRPELEALLQNHEHR